MATDYEFLTLAPLLFQLSNFNSGTISDFAVTADSAYALTTDRTIGYAPLGPAGTNSPLNFVETPRENSSATVATNETIKLISKVTKIVAGKAGDKAGKSFAVGSGKNNIVVVQPPADKKLRVGVVALGNCQHILATAASLTGYAVALVATAKGETINDGKQIGVVTTEEEDVQALATDSAGED